MQRPAVFGRLCIGCRGPARGLQQILVCPMIDWFGVLVGFRERGGDCVFSNDLSASSEGR